MNNYNKFLLTWYSLVVTIIPIHSCCPAKSNESENVSTSNDKEKLTIEKIYQVMKPDGKGGGSLRVIKIDSCEYLMWYETGGIT